MQHGNVSQTFSLQRRVSTLERGVAMTIQPLLKLHYVIGDSKRGIQGYIPISRSAWYAGIKAGAYPAGVKIGQRSVAWRQSDIESLLKRLGGDA